MSESALAAALDRIGKVQAHLSGPNAVLLAILAVAAAVIPELWLVTRHITVMAHEGAHATMGSALGHRVTGIRFRRNADGETALSGGGFLGTVTTTVVGYLGPSVFGIGAAELIRIGHIVAVLWAGLGGLVAILATLRWSFGVLTVILTLALLFLVAGFATVGVQVLTAYVIAWFLLVSSVRIIRMRGKEAADAAKLRALTKIPSGFWSNLWLLGSVGALVYGATLLV